LNSAGRNQLWVLPGDGEARMITAHPTAVEHFSWRRDGAAVAFAATDEEPRKEGEARFITTFEVGAQDLFLRRTLRPRATSQPRAHCASASGFSRRMQPWLKARTSFANSAPSGVSCKYMLKAFRNRNFTRPSECFGPGFCRMRVSRPSLKYSRSFASMYLESAAILGAVSLA
jgi:hypothetical protein